MKTASVIQITCDKPLHLRTDSELIGVRVSSVSEWHGPRWDLDNLTPGSKGTVSRINWEIALPNGHTLLDPPYARLLDWLRRFVWSLFADPGVGAALKPGTAGAVSSGLAKLVPWMVENSIRLPKELDRHALESYRCDLPELLASSEDDDESRVTLGASTQAIAIVYRLWQQRHVLARIGIDPMPEKPWSEFKGANTLVKSIASEARGWIQPLPDEVAVPLLNRATWFLGVPADDVMRLQDSLSAAFKRPSGSHWSGPGTSQAARWVSQRTACKAFAFSVPEGETAPWHPALDLETRTDGNFGGMVRVMQIVKHLQAAALLVLQGFTGLRVSELCGLPAGIDPATGWPLCVEVRSSSTGLNEEFILRSDLSKTESVPREVPWQIGMRPKGSEEVPITVHALLILNRLLAPYRSLRDSDRLLISLNSHTGLPKTRLGVGRIATAYINSIYRDFVEAWVDLTLLEDESIHRTAEKDLVKWRLSKGRIFTSHRLRKTYALYVLSVDPRLLPAVKRQFQHLSMAMTERGYWGTNILQIEPVNAVAAQQTAMFMFELATGRTKTAGKMGDQIEGQIAELRTKLSGLGIEAGWRETVRWVRNNDLKITFGAHGGCLPLASSNMECWKKSGRRPLGHLEPNYETREPGLCAGCSCFWMDARHRPFWEKRFVENEVAFRGAEARGQAAMFRRVRDRAVQARAFLQHIGVDVAPLVGRVKEELEIHAI